MSALKRSERQASGHLRFALTISVRHGRPKIMIPLPFSTANLASLSSCLLSAMPSCVEPFIATHSVLRESIRHAVAVALHLATDLDEDCAEVAELAGDRRLEGAIVLGLGQTVGFHCQSCSWFKGGKSNTTWTYLAMKMQALGG